MKKECKLQIVDTIETDGDRFVNYLVPDNQLGITAMRLVTLYETDDKDHWVNPTWFEVQSTDINDAVIEAVCGMTGWSLEQTASDEYHDGWHVLTHVNMVQHNN